MDLSAYGSGIFGSQRSKSMGSFKLRLVIYFMLLALLPLVAATVAFGEVAERGEVGSADSRLSTALRVAVADYEEQLDEDTVETARFLARTNSVPQDLASGNRAALAQTANAVEHSAFYSPKGDLLAGEPPGPPDGRGRSPSGPQTASSSDAWSSTFRSTTRLRSGLRTVQRSTRAIASPSSPTSV